VAKGNHEEPGPDVDVTFINFMKKEFEEHIKDPVLKLLADTFLNFLYNNKEFIEIVKILYAQQFELTTANEDLLDFGNKHKTEKRWNIVGGLVSILDNASKIILPFSFNSLLAIPGFVLTGTEFGVSFLKKRSNTATRNKLKDCQLKMGQRLGNKTEDDKKNFMFNVLHPEIINNAITDLNKIYDELKTYIEINNYTNLVEDLPPLKQDIDVLRGYTNTHSLMLNILNGVKIIAGLGASIMEMIPFTHDYNLINSDFLTLTPGNVAVLVSSSLTLLHTHIEKADRDARYAESAVKICETYTSLLALFENLIVAPE
jgi:hypothetical protein